MSRELMKNHPEIKKFTTIWMDTVRGGAFGLSNTNKLIRFYNGATGLKTGFTSGAGYCLSATALREGLELIAVVMGAESSQDRFHACKTMLNHGFASYALIQPEIQDGPADVTVRLGRKETVSARLGSTEPMLIDKQQRQSVIMEVELEESVAAPVSQGQRLGTMTVKAGEQVLSQIPLVAAEAVERQSLGALFVKVLKRAAMAG
jgi:D-alanyl-D-alanine carboxypeptidase (penicillin-binding protein 5/6)